MALVYDSYEDSYLKSLVTEDRESRAINEVDSISSNFDDAWKERLSVIKAYEITSLECIAEKDDLFDVKYKHYRALFETLKVQALANTTDDDGDPVSSLSYEISRS